MTSVDQKREAILSSGKFTGVGNMRQVFVIRFWVSATFLVRKFEYETMQLFHEVLCSVLYYNLFCVKLVEHFLFVCFVFMLFVFFSALIHDIFAFLSYVISDLATGEYVASGCTLRFILEWAWKQASIIKDSINSLCKIINCPSFVRATRSINKCCMC